MAAATGRRAPSARAPRSISRCPIREWEMEGPKPEVLLVEDDANDVAVALRAFRKHALVERVRVLRDGAELVDYLDSHKTRPPKLILLDLKMQRMDGRAELREP